MKEELIPELDENLEEIMDIIDSGDCSKDDKDELKYLEEMKAYFDEVELDDIFTVASSAVCVPEFEQPAKAADTNAESNTAEMIFLQLINSRLLCREHNFKVAVSAS